MSFIEVVHGKYTYGRRVRVLSGHLAALIPRNAQVLDVGCGDGHLAQLIMEKRPDIKARGIVVLVRQKTRIPVDQFDGRAIPHADNSFDVVMFNDVLHHTDDPMILLREAARVSRQSIVIKDHTCDGILAGPTLEFMDRIGNARHGVVLPYNYWPKQRWQQAFGTLGLPVVMWKKKLNIYPHFADLVFGRSLHFVARLDLRPADSQ